MNCSYLSPALSCDTVRMLSVKLAVKAHALPPQGLAAFVAPRTTEVTAPTEVMVPGEIVMISPWYLVESVEKAWGTAGWRGRM